MSGNICGLIPRSNDMMSGNICGLIPRSNDMMSGNICGLIPRSNDMMSGNICGLILLISYSFSSVYLCEIIIDSQFKSDGFFTFNIQNRYGK